MLPRPVTATALLLLASCATQPQAEPEATTPLIVSVPSADEAKASESPQGSVDELPDEAEPTVAEQPKTEHERIAEALAELDNAQVLGVLGPIGVLDTADGGSIAGLGLGHGSGRGGGGRLGRSATGTSVVAPTAVAVKGSLPKDIIQRVIRQRFSQFRFCYEQQLQQDPKLEGKVVVKFVIARDGSVSTANIAESLHPAVDTCVQRSFMGMKFPKPSGGIVVVSYPLKFRTDDGT